MQLLMKLNMQITQIFFLSKIVYCFFSHWPTIIEKFNIPIIGITGTNGKTTSKELINAVLETQLNVLATKGNLNNHIGVPLTLLDINSNHDIAIIEMGASKPGDIKELCEIAEPTHGTITNIGSAHLEGFKTFEGVYKTKMELFDFINETNGIFTFNENDSVFDALQNKKSSATLMPFGEKIILLEQ